MFSAFTFNMHTKERNSTTVFQTKYILFFFTKVSINFDLITYLTHFLYYLYVKLPSSSNIDKTKTHTLTTRGLSYTSSQYKRRLYTFREHRFEIITKSHLMISQHLTNTVTEQLALLTHT